MKVRLATDDDMEELMRMGMAFIRSLPDRDLYPDDEEIVRESAEYLMSLPQIKCWICDGGMLGMLCGPCLWNRRQLQAEEICFWVDDGAPNTTALRLLRTAIKDMKSWGIGLFCFHMLETSPKSLSSLYERMGLQRTHCSYGGKIGWT